MLDAVRVIPKLLCRVITNSIAIALHRKELLGRHFRYEKSGSGKRLASRQDLFQASFEVFLALRPHSRAIHRN